MKGTFGKNLPRHSREYKWLPADFPFEESYHRSSSPPDLPTPRPVGPYFNGDLGRVPAYPASAANR